MKAFSVRHVLKKPMVKSMTSISAKGIIEKTQEKLHEQLQCKQYIFKSAGENVFIGFSGKNMLQKISKKCMKLEVLCIFHFQCKKRSGIKSLPFIAIEAVRGGFEGDEDILTARDLV